MNRTLNDFDKCFNESKTKMKSDFERSLRGLNFGKLYLKNGEYETALKYVTSYLSVRPNSSEGHKLLAQIYESIGEDETALLNYKKALDLKKNSNENYLSSIQSPISTSSMTENNRIIENNSIPSVDTTPVRKERTSEKVERSHSSGTCSNQSVLNKIVKQNENLMETNKIILDILRQNNSNIIDIQKRMDFINESINNLMESQNLMKDTLYDFMAQEEHQDFDEYLLDDKENDSLDRSGLLAVANSQSAQWHSSGLQLLPTCDQNKPLSELFKPAVDSWKCDACYVQNNASDTSCAACTTPKPGVALEQVLPEPIKQTFGFGSPQPFSFKPAVTNTSGFRFGSETNPTIESNTIFSNTNFKFGNTSPSVVPPAIPAFTSFQTSSPQIGLQINKSNDNMFAINPNLSDSKLNSFQFGLSRTFDFEFPKLVKEDPINASKVEDYPQIEKEEEQQYTSLNDSQVEPSNADNIYFQPVVPLPPKIEVKTGEEEENVLHSCRARLFRFCDNEWKERGVGELKILESRDSNRIRLLMRRDTIFKVCLNQYITEDLNLDLKDDKKSFTWSAIDYSEDTPIPQIFLLRLKNAENAQLFINAVEKAKSGIKSDDSFKIESKPSIETTLKEKDINKEKIIQTSNDSNTNSSKDEDIEIVYQKMPESKEILDRVTQLKLPLNFFDYENMPPCPGCRGCQDYDFPLFSKFEQKIEEKAETDPLNLDSTEESLFSSLIAATNISQTDWKNSSNGKNLWLSNEPKPIFSSPSQDDDAVPTNPDIYFKPLIPLPDLIEVKTGEEDETPIYCQRAKLYRYDPQLKEWKERGIGDFKILKHKSKNRYRMVLRRDQILKIACNHYITSLISLNPMNTSETAVCWYAIDYTDGNPIEEQFALKFKNRDLLQEFIKTFNDCKNNLDINELDNSDIENSSDANEGTPLE